MYDFTLANAFCTGSDAKISSSIIAVDGSSTSGDPAPNDPYFAALALDGEKVSVTAAAVVAVVIC